MPRKPKSKPKATEPTKPRSNLHEILRGRKAAKHKRGSEKRKAQKLRRELEQD